MRKIIAALCATACLALSLPTPVLAQATSPGGRSVAYPNGNPPSTQANQTQRYTRLALGTWLLNALNLQSNGAGVYANCTVAPATGLYVTVAPTLSGSLCALYQVAEDDANPIPVNYTPQLAADSTLIAIQALQGGTSSALGPLTAPGSNSVWWLIEAQVNTTDTDATSTLFVTPQGQRVFSTVNLQRTDEFNYALKSGTPGATPVQPAPDSGYVAIAYVEITAGQSQVESGNISQTGTAAPFTGFVANGNFLQLQPTASPSPQSGNGATTGTIAAGTFYGSGAGLTNLQPSALATCVPQNKGGTGTCSPTWIAAGGSGNVVVTGSGPNQTIDVSENPVFSGAVTANELLAPTIGTQQIVPSPSSSPIAVASPGLLVDSLRVAPGASPTASACPGGEVCASAGVVQANTNVGSCFFCYGTGGTASAAVLRFGSAASPVPSTSPTSSPYTSFGAANDGTVQSVRNSVLSIGNTGTRVLAIDNAGDLGVLAGVYAASFTGSGSGLTSATVPNTSLVTLPVTSVACSAPVICSPSAAPTPAISVNTYATAPANNVVLAQGTASPSPQPGYVAVLGTLYGSNLTISSMPNINCLGTNSTGLLVSNNTCAGSGTITGVSASNGLYSTGGAAPNIQVSPNAVVTAQAPMVIEQSLVVSATASPLPTVSPGDFWVSASNTTARIGLGGNTGTSPSHCFLDYGETTSSVLTAGCAVTSSGAVSGSSLVSSGGIAADGNSAPSNGLTCGVAGTTPCKFVDTSNSTTTEGFTFTTSTACHLGADTLVNFEVNSTSKAYLTCNGGGFFDAQVQAGESNSPPTVTSGDLSASRSSTTGALVLGGSSSAATCDYGVTTASTLTCNKALSAPTITLGAAGSYSQSQISYGTGISSGSCSGQIATLGTSSSAIQSITGSIASFGCGSTQLAAIDYSGSLAVKDDIISGPTGTISSGSGGIESTGDIYTSAGYISAQATSVSPGSPCSGSGTPGFLCSAVTASSGGLALGGTSSTCTLDYGVSYTGVGYLSCPLKTYGNINSGGTITATTAQGCGAITGYHVECERMSVTVSCTAGTSCSIGTFSFTTAFTSDPLCYAVNANPATTAASELQPSVGDATTTSDAISAYAPVTLTSATVRLNVFCVGV